MRLLTVLFCLIYLPSFAQNTYEQVLKKIQAQNLQQSTHQHCRYDSILNFTFSPSGIDSVLSGKTLYEYDNQGNWSSKADFTLSSDSIFFQNIETTRLFDAQNNLLFWSEKGFNSLGSLTSHLDEASFYDGNGRLDSFIRFVYDFSLQELVISFKSNYRYNSLGQNDLTRNYTFDQDSQAYFLDFTAYHYFNPNGQIDSTIEIDALTNQRNTEVHNTYTAFDSIEQSVVLTSLFGGLDTFVVFDYSYGLQNYVRETWINIIFLGSSTYERFQFDSEGELLQRLVALDGFGLTYGDRYDYFYKPQNSCRLTHDYYTGENPNFSDTVFTERSYYFLSDVVSSYKPKTELALSLYPNPTSGVLFIQDKEFDYLEAHIYNANGQRIQSFERAAPLVLKLEQSGIYFIHFHTREGVFVEKVLFKR